MAKKKKTNKKQSQKERKNKKNQEKDKAQDINVSVGFPLLEAQSDSQTSRDDEMRNRRRKTRKTTQAVTRRQRGVNNLYTLTGCSLCFFKFQQQIRVLTLERRKKKRMKQFGIEYTNLMLEPSIAVDRRRCLREAMEDLEDINENIEKCYYKIDKKIEELESRNRPSSHNERKASERDIQRNPSHRLSKKKASNQRFTSNKRTEDDLRPMSVVEL